MFLESEDITSIDLTQHYYEQIFEGKIGYNIFIANDLFVLA